MSSPDAAELVQRAADHLATPPAAPAAGVPDGWKLVPVVATPEMVGVDGLSPLLRHGAGSNDRVQQWRGCLWEAMLAAAPSPPVPPAESGS